MFNYNNKSIDTNKDNIIKLIFLLFNAILFIRILSYSWVTDDAFITLRSVINFVDGYGPVYNIGERVQSFTHPLWFFLLSIGGFLDINLYFWSIFLGLIFSFAIIVILYKIYIKTLNNFNYFIILIALIFSETFLSYQTSGLENSLTNFLIVMFLYYYIFTDLDKVVNFIIFYLIAGLILVNRLDQIFLIFLPMVHVFYNNNFQFIKKIKFFCFSFTPFFLWTVFSIIYYGFFFPNTKYAKVGGRTILENFDHGLRYSIEFIQTEFHIIVILLIVIMVLILLNKRIEFKLILIGIFIQVFYIFYIGGDFMRGRFFDSIIVVSIFLFFNLNISEKLNNNKKLILIALFIIVSFLSYNIAFNEKLILKFPGMENERNYYKEYLALDLDPFLNYDNHPWAVDGQKINEKYRTKSVTIIGVNGMRGYYTTNNIIIIDPVGLTDAFISRIPVIDNTRTGHFKRDIPEEYYNERLNNIQIDHWNNTNYQILNLHIRNITQSQNLFTINRFKSMLWVWKNYGI